MCCKSLKLNPVSVGSLFHVVFKLSHHITLEIMNCTLVQNGICVCFVEICRDYIKHFNLFIDFEAKLYIVFRSR